MMLALPFFHYFFYKKKRYGTLIFKKNEKTRDAEPVTFWNGCLLP